MKLIQNDPRPFRIFIYACLFILLTTTCIIGLMYSDYILQMAKAKQVPHITVQHADYISINHGAIEISGVTPEGGE